MIIDLSIPIYVGGYRMDADALQAEMVAEQYRIISAVLSDDERSAIRRRCNADKQWSVEEIDAAYFAEMERVIADRLDNRDRHGWTVRELLVRFEDLRIEMARDYGIVR